MKKTIAIISIIFFAACGGKSEGKGNPELVKQAEKVAELGCACADVNCLFEIKVDGNSVTKIIMAKTDDLTNAEKEQYYAAVRKYGDCERVLSDKAKEKK